jgi:hypothetical protein
MKKALHNCTEASGLLLLFCLLGRFLNHLCLLPASLRSQLPGCACTSSWQQRFGLACRLVACPSPVLQPCLVH